MVCTISIYGQSIGKEDSIEITRFAEYLRNHVRYPAVAQRDTIYGSVIIAFKINSDNTFTNIEVLEGIPANCAAEVVRVLKNVHGNFNLRPNDYTIVVNFQLAGEGDMLYGRDAQFKEPGKYLKNFLTEINILGYLPHVVKSYQIDRSLPPVVFDGHKGKIRSMTITYKNDDTLTRKEVQVFNKEQKLVERRIYISKNTLVNKQVIKYNSEGNQILFLEYRDGHKLYVKTNFRYDELGRKTEELRHDFVNGKASRITFQYNERGLVIMKTHYNYQDAIQDLYVLKYDNRGNKIEERRFDEGDKLTLKRISTYLYGVKNDMEKETVSEPNGSLIYSDTYTYDDKRRKVSDLFNIPLNSVNLKNTFKYDDKGNKTEEINDVSDRLPSGIKSSFTYSNIDGHGNWLKVKWVNGNNSSKVTLIERMIKY